MKTKILVINPVSTRAWLESDREYLQRLADKDTTVEVVGLERGPRSLETFCDVAYAGPGVLRIVREKGSEVDAIMINCFADPALDAARELTDKVVLGAGETSMSVAIQLGPKFSVISVLKNTASWVRIQAAKLGIEGKLTSAIGVDIPVLDLGKDPERTVRAIVESAREAIEKDGAEVIVLGCTGMAGLAAKIRERLDVPLIEPAATTLKMAEMLVKLGLRHNRGGLYLPLAPDKIAAYEEEVGA
jgi:allantoin racemase